MEVVIFLLILAGIVSLLNGLTKRKGLLLKYKKIDLSPLESDVDTVKIPRSTWDKLIDIQVESEKAV